MTRRRVVLTGRGVVSPLGVGLEAHWQALLAGRSAVAPLPALAGLGLPVSRGAGIGPELLAPHAARLPRKQQKLYNRATLLAMLGAALAMEDAALGAGAGDPRRFGVLLGVDALWWDLAAMTRYLEASEAAAPGTLDMAAANAFCMKNINPLDYSLKTLPNLAAGHVAIAHDAQGLCRALVDGPVGGAHAVGQAYRMVAEGALDVALCGASDARLEALHFASSWGIGLLASDAGDRPGTVFGEGAGLLVLEAAGAAQARSARVHAEVLGFAVAAGEGRLTPDDDAERLAARLVRVIDEVLDEAGGVPDLVCLHADGAPAHDAAEQAALRKVLGSRADATPIVRFKPLQGDLGAAAAPVELLACSALLTEAAMPPAIAAGPAGFAAPPRRALVLSLGDFGESAALMLGRP